MWRYLLVIVIGIPALAQQATNAYFGDLHVHTKYSFDAYIFGTTTGPEDAYEFARGATIKHASGTEMTLDRPLDFFAVTDHAMFLGNLNALEDPEHPRYEEEEAVFFRSLETVADRGRAFGSFHAFLNEDRDFQASRDAWQAIIEAANRYYEPGVFTTFIGYEYTTGYPTDGGNLHRNVIFAGDRAPSLPFSRLEDLNPEKLWDWMDENRAAGMESISIPHNSNGSNGHMFELQKFEGGPLDVAYAEQRMRNEPLVEISQVKGTSETHPALSPNDEWAFFEIFPFRIAQANRSNPVGSYVREAWQNGLAIEAEIGANPYKFGVVAASDTHNSGEVFDEQKFVGKIGMLDHRPIDRGSVPVGYEDDRPGYRDSASQYFSSAGIAAVWAAENTREAIFEAFRRKETFATSGTRIRVRFYAGYDYSEDILEDTNFVNLAYAGGVPMGSNLSADEQSPTFLVWALQDPLKQKLQRVQIIKGWLQDNGTTKEMVYDVACSDGLEVNPETHRCPWNDSNVDFSDCSTPADLGAADLKARWQDPDYNPSQNAFYYVRVLENPTCRWSTWDAVRNETAVKQSLRQNRAIQERAWTSPIWLNSIASPSE